MPFYIDVRNFIFTNTTSRGLKIILMAHFILTSLGGIGSSSPVVYVFYNLLILIALFWSIEDEKNHLEALRLVMAFELCACLIDLIYIGVLVDDLYGPFMTFKEPFSAAMMFIQFLTRPYVVFYLLKYKSTQNFAVTESDEYSSVEMGQELLIKNSMQKNHTDPTAKEIISVENRKNSIENNPFENDDAEVASENT